MKFKNQKQFRNQDEGLTMEKQEKQEKQRRLIRYQLWLKKGWITEDQYKLIIKLAGRRLEVAGHTWEVEARHKKGKTTLYLFCTSEKIYGSALYQITDRFYLFDLRLGNGLIYDKRYYIWDTAKNQVKELKEIGELFANLFFENTRLKRELQREKQKALKQQEKTLT